MRKFFLFLIYSILLIPALPPVFVPVFEPYTFGKTELFGMLVELMALALLTTFFREKGSLFSFFRNSPVAKAVCAFAGAAAISTFFSADISASFWGSSARNDGLFVLLHFFLFFTALAVTLGKQEWQKLFRFSLGASAFISLYALCQYASLPFVRPSGGEIFGTLGNPAYLGMYLLFHVFLAVFLARAELPGNKAMLWYALAVLESIIILLTHNRASLLGLFIGMLFFVLFSLYAKIRGTTGKKIFAGLVAFIVLALMAIGTSAALRLARNDATAQSRLLAWRVALAGISEHPFFGHGANQFESFYDASVERMVLAPPTPETFDKPHNIILETLFSYGVFGLAAYLALWGTLVYTLRKKYMHMECFLWYGTFISYGISLFFLFDTFSSLLVFSFFLAFFASQESGGLRLPDSAPFIQMGMALAGFAMLFFLFHFKPLYSAYWGRALLVQAETTGTVDANIKAKALYYDSFNAPLIESAIRFTEQNTKK